MSPSRYPAVNQPRVSRPSAALGAKTKKRFHCAWSKSFDQRIGFADESSG